MPIYNGYPQVYYPQQPQGQLEQLRAAQYQPQPVMMPTMQGQATPTDSGFIWVQGEAAARGYLVANGSRVLLLDADSDTFYIKEVGQDGRPFPLRIYDYKERTSGPKASIAATQAAGGELCHPQGVRSAGGKAGGVGEARSTRAGKGGLNDGQQFV